MRSSHAYLYSIYNINIFIWGKMSVNIMILWCEIIIFSRIKKNYSESWHTVCALYTRYDVVSIRKTDGTINQYCLAEITGGRARPRGRQLWTYGRFEKSTRIKDVGKRPTRLSLSSTGLPIDHRYTHITDAKCRFDCIYALYTILL